MKYMRSALTNLSTFLRHLWLPLVGIILLIVVGVGMSAVLHTVRPEPLWTNATKELTQRVKSEATQSLDITLSRGEFINIDGPGGIIIGTITDHAARQRLLASQPFRDCAFGCTGWMAYSQLGRTLPLDSSEKVSGHARTLLSSAAAPDSSCIIRFHYLGQTLPDKHGSPDLGIICLSQRTGALVDEFRAA